jgi:hypothetical protein
MGINIEPPDWVDSDNHIIDRNNLKNHTDSYIRQLLTATFDEFFKRKKERKKRKELVKSITKIENDWGMI